MSARRYCVRIVSHKFQKVEGAPPNIEPWVPTEFIESLRYAQLVTPHAVEANDFYAMPELEDKQVFDIEAPHGMDSKRWAEMNAKRMRTFGFNAVAAPSTLRG